MRVELVVAIGVLLACGQAHAAGFAVSEQGTESLGLANAATARLDSADVGFFNPAAWAIQPGFVASAGAALVSPSFEHSDETRTEIEPGLETPPYVHAGGSADLGEFTIGGGAGFMVPYGAGLKWPDGWPGRFDVISIELRLFEVATSVAIGMRFDDFELAIAAGPRLILGSVGLKRAIDAVDQEASVSLDGDGNAHAARASLAARYRAFSLGLSFRSKATVDFDGWADFQNAPIELSGPLRDQPVSTSVTLPDRWALGLAYDFDVGIASLDAEYFGWSTFDVFAIRFSEPDTPDVVEPRNWHDTVALRAGYEHRMFDPLRVRAGFAYDPTPSPTDTLSPTLPDSDRWMLSAGAGYTFGFGLTADLAYSRVIVTETVARGEEIFEGTYSGSADIVSFGLSWRLGRL